MTTTITIDLDDDLRDRLEKECRATGKNYEEVIEEILRRHVLLQEFGRLRTKLVPRGEALGYRTDDDVFRIVS